MSNKSWTELRDQDSTQKLVYSTLGSGQQVNNQQIINLLEANDLPPVQIYDGKVEVLDSSEVLNFTETRVVDENLVLFLPPVNRFPRGFGRVIEGVTSDQHVQANDGLIPSGLGGGIYGWVEKFLNPGRYEAFAAVAAGFDIESIPYQGTLDVDGEPE